MSGSHRRQWQWGGGTAGVRRPGRVRLTRRGRVVVCLGLLLGGLLAVAALLVVATPASQAADPAPAEAADPLPAGAAGGEPLVAVVRPGDTLWSVAARHLPSRDAYGTIEEIRELNHLSDHTIHPGQKLRLPGRR